MTVSIYDRLRRSEIFRLKADFTFRQFREQHIVVDGAQDPVQIKFLLGCESHRVQYDHLGDQHLIFLTKQAIELILPNPNIFIRMKLFRNITQGIDHKTICQIRLGRQIHTFAMICRQHPIDLAQTTKRFGNGDIQQLASFSDFHPGNWFDLLFFTFFFEFIDACDRVDIRQDKFFYPQSFRLRYQIVYGKRSIPKTMEGMAVQIHICGVKWKN
ncbi:hypothetical protein D3C87_1385920 [compost metagenome]